MLKFAVISFLPSACCWRQVLSLKRKCFKMPLKKYSKPKPEESGEIPKVNGDIFINPPPVASDGYSIAVGVHVSEVPETSLKMSDVDPNNLFAIMHFDFNEQNPALLNRIISTKCANIYMSKSQAKYVMFSIARSLSESDEDCKKISNTFKQGVKMTGIVIKK